MVVIDGTRYRRSFAERNGLLGETAELEGEGALITSPPADKARTPRSASVKGGRAAKGAAKAPATPPPAPTETPDEESPAGDPDPSGEPDPNEE